MRFTQMIIYECVSMCICAPFDDIKLLKESSSPADWNDLF